MGGGGCPVAVAAAVFTGEVDVAFGLMVSVKHFVFFGILSM